MDWVKKLFTDKVFDDIEEHFEEKEQAPEPAPKKEKKSRKKKAESKPSADKSLPTFEGMTKLEIDIWARKELGVNIDRRRTREYMIEEIHNHLKKEK